MLKALNTINDYCLYLLVFSITFEMWDPFKLVGSYSITFLTTILYFATWVPLIAQNFNGQILRRFGIPLFLFIIAGFVATALKSEYVLEFKEAYNYRALLLIILMVFIASHLYIKDHLIPRVINIYLFSMLILYFLTVMGAGVSYINGRLYLFGENPNMIGAKSAIALLIVISRLYKELSLKRLILSAVLCFPFISLIVLSGSRGAFISVFFGLTVLTLFRKTGLAQKTLLIVFGSLASIALLFYMLEESPILKERLQVSIESGDIGRGNLWKSALEIIQDNPLIGVGFPGVMPTMYRYSGQYMDTHNVFLTVLVSTGLIGFIFFITFLLRLTRDLFIQYRYSGETIYGMIFLITILNMAKQGGSIRKIVFWFFFAVLIAVSVNVGKRLSDQN